MMQRNEPACKITVTCNNYVDPLDEAEDGPFLEYPRALMRNLLVSFGRVVEGFAVAVVLVFPLGLFMGSFTKVRAMFTPLSVFGAYLSIPALVPLTLSLFGNGELQKVVFLALAFAIYLLPLVTAAVDPVPDTLLKTAYTLGAGRLQTVRKVLLPVAWPRVGGSPMADEEERLTEEEFVTQAIKKLRKDPFRGIHSVYSGFQRSLSKVFRRKSRGGDLQAGQGGQD